MSENLEPNKSSDQFDEEKIAQMFQKAKTIFISPNKVSNSGEKLLELAEKGLMALPPVQLGQAVVAGLDCAVYTFKTSVDVLADAPKTIIRVAEKVAVALTVDEIKHRRELQILSLQHKFKLTEITHLAKTETEAMRQRAENVFKLEREKESLKAKTKLWPYTNRPPEEKFKDHELPKVCIHIKKKWNDEFRCNLDMFRSFISQLEFHLSIDCDIKLNDDDIEEIHSKASEYRCSVLILEIYSDNILCNYYSASIWNSLKNQGRKIIISKPLTHDKTNLVLLASFAATIRIIEFLLQFYKIAIDERINYELFKRFHDLALNKSCDNSFSIAKSLSTIIQSDSKSLLNKQEITYQEIKIILDEGINTSKEHIIHNTLPRIEKLLGFKCDSGESVNKLPIEKWHWTTNQSFGELFRIIGREDLEDIHNSRIRANNAKLREEIRL